MSKQRKANCARTKGQPFFDDVYATLSYTQTVSTTASVGFYGTQLTQNDVYDPDFTGIGGQPYGFDQWMAQYSRFTVESSEITVTCTSRAVSGLLEVAVVPVTSTITIPASYEAAMAMRFAKGCSTTGGSTPKKMVSGVATADLIGVPQYALVGDLNYSGTSSTSPTMRTLWCLVCETSGASDALSLSIKVSYRVRLWGLIPVALSATRHRPSEVPRVVGPNRGVPERREAVPVSPAQAGSTVTLGDTAGTWVFVPASDVGNRSEVASAAISGGSLPGK